MIEAESQNRVTWLARISAADWFIAGAVLMLLGYFLPWFKHPLAGLTLIGLDISEWLKFLPQFQSGELPNRNYFYLPPIILGALLILWAAFDIKDRFRGWVMTGVGVCIALIGLPALEALPLDAQKFAQTSEWAFRLILIGCVGLLGLSRPLLQRVPARWLVMLMAIITLIGGILPARLLYLSRSAYIFWLRLTPNPGLGFGLHVLASIFILIACWHFFRKK